MGYPQEQRRYLFTKLRKHLSNQAAVVGIVNHLLASAVFKLTQI
jgi:hypothetical protein